MSTPGPPLPDEPAPRSSLRIGDAERNAAADALQQHLTAGRLTLDEYADRAAIVNTARTQDEVDRVFADLPPVPGAPGGLAVRPGTGSPLAAAAGVPPVPAGPGRSGVSKNVLRGLMGGLPIIALLLFLITGLWYFFLMIPLGYLVLGPILNGGDDDDRRPELERGDPDR